MRRGRRGRETNRIPLVADRCRPSADVRSCSGSRGRWTATGNHGTGVNVSFAVGSYYYLVGSGSPTGTHGAPGQVQMSQAAQSIYLTISGCTTRHVGTGTAS